MLSTELDENVRGRSERDKPDRRRSTKLTIPPNSDARFCSAGQLATAVACSVSLLYRDS